MRVGGGNRGWVSGGSRMFGGPRKERHFAPLEGMTVHPGNQRKFQLGMGLALFYSFVSVLIFNFQHYITRVVSSTEICFNRLVFDVMSWILPKAAWHCELMGTRTLLLHPYREITLVLDLWFLVVCLAQLVFSFSALWKDIRDRQDELSRIFREHRKMSINFMLLSAFVIGVGIWMVFFWVPLVEEPGTLHPWLALLADNYGLSAGVLTFPVGIIFFIFSAPGLLVFLAFLKSFSKEMRSNSQT